MRSAQDHNARLAKIVRRLDELQLDAADPLDEILPDARALLEVDSIAMYAVREHRAGWGFDRWSFHQMPSARIRDGAERLFNKSGISVLFYDASRPTATQRNRLIEGTALLDATIPGGWKASAMCTEVMAPLGLDNHRQHRILLCEGASLLAWFGTFHDGPLTQRQGRLLKAVAAPLRRRLRTERLIDGTPRRIASLKTALDQIGGAAFLVTATGAIVATNAVGGCLLATGDRAVRAALDDAIYGRPGEPGFTLIAIRERGVPPHWLAIAQRSRDARIAVALEAARRRWQLTPRQSRVADLVVRGLSNAAIAAELSQSTRATELHVTALFDRIGVDNRAALVAAVLLASA